MDDLVLIEAFPTLGEADVVLGLLAAAGIEGVVNETGDETFPGGSAYLWIKQEDAGRAREVIRAAESAGPDEAEAEEAAGEGATGTEGAGTESAW